jgi:hypothetical protein
LSAAVLIYRCVSFDGVELCTSRRSASGVVGFVVGVGDVIVVTGFDTGRSFVSPTGEAGSLLLIFVWFFC